MSDQTQNTKDQGAKEPAKMDPYATLAAKVEAMEKITTAQAEEIASLKSSGSNDGLVVAPKKEKKRELKCPTVLIGKAKKKFRLKKFQIIREGRPEMYIAMDIKNNDTELLEYLLEKHPSVFEK